MKDQLLKHRELILSGNLWKAVILLTLPVALTALIEAVYQFIDILFIASLGSRVIAAVTFVAPIYRVVWGVSMGLAVAGTNLTARNISRKKFLQAKNIILQQLIIAITLALLITAFCYWFSKQILITASASLQILDVANQYYKLLVLSIPFVFINATYLGIKMANGDTITILVVNTISMIIKIILTYLFIFHIKMGVNSLALSTILGTMLVSIYGFYDLFLKKSIIRLTFKHFAFDRSALVTLFTIAIPIMVEKSSIALGFVAVNQFVISFGEKVLAGYGITNRINSVFFATISGFASGLAPIISQNLAIGQQLRAKEGIKKTLLMAMLIAIAIVSLVLYFKVEIASLFAKEDGEVLRHTVNAMSIYSISIIPWAIFQVVNGVFQGTGHTKYNLFMSLARIYCFRLPIVFVFSTYFRLYEYSIWYGMLISNILTGFLAIIIFYHNSRKFSLVGE